MAELELIGTYGGAGAIILAVAVGFFKSALGKPVLDKLSKGQAAALATTSVIAALALGLFAVHRATAPAPPPTAADTSATSHGPCSPVVRETGGSVSITLNCPLTLTPLQLQQIVEAVRTAKTVPLAEFQTLAEQLGVTKTAVRGFLARLGQENVAIEDLDATLRRIAANHLEFLEKVGRLDAPDPAAARLKQDALAAIDSGDYAKAETLLGRLEADELAAAERAEGEAAQRRLAAAAARAGRAMAKELSFRYAEAAADYEIAFSMLPANQFAEAITYCRSAGRSWQGAGNYDKAIDIFRKGLQLINDGGLKDSQTESAFLNDYGILLYELGYHKVSYETLTRSLSIFKKSPDNPASLTILKTLNLAEILFAQRKLLAARTLFEEALALSEKNNGINHPQTANAIGGLGKILYEEGKYDEAERMLKKAITAYEKSKNQEQENISGLMNSLGLTISENTPQANAELKFRRIVEAERLFRKSIGIMETMYGMNHPRITPALNNLGALFLETGDFRNAVNAFERSLRIIEAKFGKSHPESATIMNNIASSYFKLEEWVKARDILYRALEIAETTHGKDHIAVANIMQNLGVVHFKLQNKKDALDMLERARDIFFQNYGREHPSTKQAEQNIMKVKVFSTLNL